MRNPRVDAEAAEEYSHTGQDRESRKARIVEVRMATMSIHEVKARLASALKAVEESSETLVVCRHGKPIVEITPHRQRSRTQVHPVHPGRAQSSCLCCMNWRYWGAAVRC
jgi:antitoxin (DNA-binding transcriptional repressor) of toxin-antitoxin stability system